MGHDTSTTTSALLHPTRRTALGVTALAAAGLLALPDRAEAHGHRPAPATLPLPDGIRPEGIAAGPGGTYYVGSLADGRIVTGDVRRPGVRTLLAGASGRQLRGLLHDHRSGLLWAVGNVGSVAHVWAVDARTGAVRADLVVSGGGFLNDLVVDRRAVWVTDSRVDRLTRIRLDRHGRPSGAPEFVPLTGAWPGYDGTDLAANGIRALPDGSLLLDHSTAGGLWVADPRTGVVAEVPVSGGPGITGGDGIELVGRTAYVVRGSGQDEVSVVRLEQRGRHHGRGAWTGRWAGRLTAPSLDVPSTAAATCGALYAVNARFGVASPDTATYWVTRLPLR